MHVTMLLDRFPVVSETFISTAMGGLVRSGVDVRVLARRRPPRGEPVHQAVRELGLVGRTTYVDAELPPDARGANGSVPLVAGCTDVLHAHFGPNALRFLFARAQADAPLVATFHGFDFGADPRLHGRDMYTALWEVADVVTHNSEHARRALAELGCPSEKLRLLRMPVDVASLPFRPRELRDGERLRIVTVGRLVEKKGHETALRALAECRDALPPFTYEVVGDGSLAGRIAALTRDLRLGGEVTFHGARDDAFVRRLLGEAHVFLLASRTAKNGDVEGAPVALAEAQACGLPVVSTTAGGITEVVLDGRSGVLVAEGDNSALAAALVWTVDHRASWPTMGAAGRAHVEQAFDVTVTTRQLLALYADAIEAHAGLRRPEPAVG
jgi:colanic acid/amylovoran biosynthesis glycosyltransferase